MEQDLQEEQNFLFPSNLFELNSLWHLRHAIPAPSYTQSVPRVRVRPPSIHEYPSVVLWLARIFSKRGDQVVVIGEKLRGGKAQILQSGHLGSPLYSISPSPLLTLPDGYWWAPGENPKSPPWPHRRGHCQGPVQGDAHGIAGGQRHLQKSWSLWPEDSGKGLCRGEPGEEEASRGTAPFWKGAWW